MSSGSRAKGRRTIKKAMDYYSTRGYLVDEVELGGRYRKSKDLFSNEEFGGFDLVALKQGRIILIQVKTNQPATRGPYIAFARKYASRNIIIEGATWYDKKGFVFHEFKKDGTVIRRDERK